MLLDDNKLHSVNIVVLEMKKKKEKPLENVKYEIVKLQSQMYDCVLNSFKCTYWKKMKADEDNDGKDSVLM